MIFEKVNGSVLTSKKVIIIVVKFPGVINMKTTGVRKMNNIFFSTLILLVQFYGVGTELQSAERLRVIMSSDFPPLDACNSNNYTCPTEMFNDQQDPACTPNWW